MRRHYQGLDLLRGLGIFILIWMHSAFYYFDGLYQLDFDNPPPIVTLIGLMLMFAGIFAMISGTAHTIQYFRKTTEQGFTNGKLLKYNTANGLLILTVAWLYFILRRRKEITCSFSKKNGGFGLCFLKFIEQVIS